MIISEKIPSCLQLIPEFIAALIEKIRPFSIEKDFNIKLCLEEALINAIRHGNKLDPDLFVNVTIKIDNSCLIIKVVDQGQGFDFGSISDPTEPGHLKKPSGRGIFLIKNLMDEVDFFDCGRGIKMVKFFKSKGGGK